MSREADLEGLFEGLESKSFYDAPTLALSRLLEGNLSWDTWKKTFFEQGALAPAERSAYTDRLKTALGGTSVGDALVDIATNPFVWFTFLTTPAGGTALKQGGRMFSSALSSTGKDFVGWAANNQSVMRTLGLLGLDTILMGTYMGPMLNWLGTKRAGLVEEIGESLVAPSRAYLEQLGRKFGTQIDRLDPAHVRNRSARAQMESDLRVLGAWMEGFGRNVEGVSSSPQRLVEVRFGSQKVFMNRGDAYRLKELAEESTKDASLAKELELGKGPSRDLKIWVENSKGGLKQGQFKGGLWKRKDRVEVLTNNERVGINRRQSKSTALFGDGTADALEQELKDRGLWDIAQKARRSREEWAVKLYGNEDVWREKGVFQADKSKVLRHFSQAAVDAERNPQLMEEILGGVREFDDAIWFSKSKDLGSKSFVELFRKGGFREKSRAKFENAMVKAIERRFSGVGTGGHVPMGTSTTDFVDSAGRVVDDIDPVRAGLMRNGGVDRVNRNVQVTWHMDDLQALRSDLSHLSVNDEVFKGMVDANEKAVIGTGEYRRVKRLDFSRGMHSFAHRSANQYLFNVMPVADDGFNVFEEMLATPIGRDGKGIRSRRMGLSLGVASDADNVAGNPFARGEGAVDLSEMSEVATDAASVIRRLEETAPGGATVSDFLDMGIRGLQKVGKGDIAEFLEHVALPRIRGEMPVRNMITMQAIVKARQASRFLADSAVGKALSSNSDFGRRTMEWLKDYGERPVRFNDAAGFLHGTAGLLYSSHMGLNVPTLILNLTQPFLNAGAWMGYGNILRSYKDAFEGMGRYANWRMTTKALRLPIAERRAKIRELLDPDGILQLSDDMLDTLDRPFTTGATPGKFKTALDVTLKAFEKTEWVNRLVTYNGLRRLFEQTHGPMSNWTGDVMRSFRSDATHMLAQTQFTSTMMSTPTMFQGGGFTGNLFANPLMRMFKTFPTRTLTSLASTSRILGHGRREFMGREFNLGPLSGLYDLGRMVGAGAVIYEVGKLGSLDLSRGLAPLTQVDSLGLGDLAYDRDLQLISTPPALSIPFDMIKGLYEGDVDSLRDAAYRMAPGGIGIRRLFEAMPSVPVVGGLLQKRYADWGNIQPDGSVPIRDATGRTIEAPNALETIARGIGFDFTKLNGRSTVMDYMSSNRDAYNQARYQALRAMRAGDMAKSLQIQNEFKARTGIPLKVTQQNLDRFIESADRTSAERFYKTLPSPVRDSLFQPTGGPMPQGDPGMSGPPQAPFGG